MTFEDYLERNFFTSYERSIARDAWNAATRAEREKCAKVCDDLAELNKESETDSMWQWGECAAAIRAMED